MKLQLKIIFIIPFFLILVISLQPILAEWKIPNPISSINFLEYGNSKIGYKIKYPDNWNKVESINNTIFFPPLKQEKINEPPSIYLKIANTSLPDIPLSIESIVDETIKNLNATTDSFKLIESEKILFNENDHTNRLIYTYKQSNNIIKTMDIGFIINNNLFLISYVSGLDNYEKYIPTIERMIGSFEPFEPFIPTPEIDSKILNKLFTPVNKNANFLGNNSSKITIVEFGDYQCPFCARFNKETKNSLVTHFVETGKVRFIFKDFIVNDLSDKASTLAAEASYCAAEQGKYWAYHDELYRNSDGENTGWITKDNLKQFANNIGIPDLMKFSECIESHKYNFLVSENDKLARSFGLTSTPSFILYNGSTPVTKIQGAYPYSVFDQVINEMD